MSDEKVSVPTEPTVEMVLAASSLHRKWENGIGDYSGGYWQAVYKAMLAALRDPTLTKHIVNEALEKAAMCCEEVFQRGDICDEPSVWKAIHEHDGDSMACAAAIRAMKR